MQSKSMPLELDLFVMAANILLAFFLFLYLELFIVTWDLVLYYRFELFIIACVVLCLKQMHVILFFMLKCWPEVTSAWLCEIFIVLFSVQNQALS